MCYVVFIYGGFDELSVLVLHLFVCDFSCDCYVVMLGLRSDGNVCGVEDVFVW